MNVNPESNPDWRSAKGTRSRGWIIRDLLESITGDPAGPVADLNPADYAPFRLIIARPGRRHAGSTVPTIDAWTWNGRGECEHVNPDAPVCWATSGLGDRCVAGRVPLFDELVRPDPTPASQDLFHRHAWPGRGAQSVLMSRPDARTVSITALEVGPGIRSMISTRIADPADESDRPAPLEPTVLTLA